jgi:conjugative transfer region protein (TIGR03748 family)
MHRKAQLGRAPFFKERRFHGTEIQVNTRSRLTSDGGTRRRIAATWLAMVALTSAGCASIGGENQVDDTTPAVASVVPTAPASAQRSSDKAGQPLPAIVSTAPDVETAHTQIGRYTVMPAQPPKDLANPLAVIATVSFPRGQVTTVGDALSHLLLRTGYRLDQSRLTEPARQLLAMTLPESHRRLGPYRVDDIVRTLIGQAWTLQVDGMVRSVAFEVHQPPARTDAITAAR